MLPFAGRERSLNFEFSSAVREVDEVERQLGWQREKMVGDGGIHLEKTRT
jgi:hypothetical protein